MGTRCLTTVRDGNKEIVCMYRQMDGYPEGHGADLLAAFKGFRITNGIAADSAKTANGAGCLAAQVVAAFKRITDENRRYAHSNGADLQVGNFYLYAPETREVGEEFVYTLSVKTDAKAKRDRIWLELYEGEVAFFGMPGTKPELMDFLYTGWLDDFDPKNCGQVYHGKVA